MKIQERLYVQIKKVVDSSCDNNIFQKTIEENTEMALIITTPQGYLQKPDDQTKTTLTNEIHNNNTLESAVTVPIQKISKCGQKEKKNQQNNKFRVLLFGQEEDIQLNYTYLQSKAKRIYKPLNNILSINHFFYENKNVNLGFSKLNYYNSLIPDIHCLKKTQTLTLKISKIFKREKPLISHQNSVNTHLFKPFYTFEDGHLECYVSSEDVFKHTINALYYMCNYYKIKIEDLRINIVNQSIKDLISSWRFHENIIICRIQSLLTFLLIQWLHSKNLRKETLQNIIVSLQKSRLIKDDKNFDQKLEKLLNSYHLSKKQFLEYFSVSRQSTLSIFIYGINFNYKNTQISAIMLPWGVKTAEELTQAIYSHNPNLKKICMVGGVGYIGDQNVRVDDIFIPDSLLKKQQDRFVTIPLDCPLDQYRNTIFKGFKVAKGCVKSVIPEFGQSFMQKHKSIIHEIDALDMEYQAIYKVTNRYKTSTFGSIFYIMDLPKKGIHLGDTYYRRDFLQLLFGKYKRAKNYCFERSLLFLSGKQ